MELRGMLEGKLYLYLCLYLNNLFILQLRKKCLLYLNRTALPAYTPQR